VAQMHAVSQLECTVHNLPQSQLHRCSTTLYQLWQSSDHVAKI